MLHATGGFNLFRWEERHGGQECLSGARCAEVVHEGEQCSSELSVFVAQRAGAEAAAQQSPIEIPGAAVVQQLQLPCRRIQPELAEQSPQVG